MAATNQRPTLVVLTTAFHENDREAARQLGLDLYEKLTRPQHDPLSFGAGIPVLCAVDPAFVDRVQAESIFVIPVLGKAAGNMNCEEAIARVHQWHEQLGDGRVLPVLMTEGWRNSEAKLPGKPLLTELYGDQPRRRATILEIVAAVSRGLADNVGDTTLFVSHAKADLEPTKQAAHKIANFGKTETTVDVFFDKTELLSGESLKDKLDFAASRGVFVAVRSDAYSSRVWCQRELLLAKQHGLPALVVETLIEGEARSLPYGGNCPTLVWDFESEPAADVVVQAVIEWLRGAHFLREGARMSAAFQLPTAKSLVRPPELLDLAQGPLCSGSPQLAMHPDPELSVYERQILWSANPKLRFVTPLTAFRDVLGRDASLPGDALLEGLQVSMSLADSPDIDGPEGFTKHHVIDVTVQLARSLVSAGASIAYGGDFRRPDLMDPKRHGYTILLAELIGAYNQTAAKPAALLHSYLAAPIPSDCVPGELQITLHHMVDSPEMAAMALLPPPSVESHPPALYFSDMRRVMAKMTNARIVIGGNAKPKPQDGGDGYSGRYPGVVEEAWRSLKESQPLYVLGGFGGGAALVADLLENKEIPERLRDAEWQKHEYFWTKAKTIDADPYREKLELPTSMEDLAKAVIKLGKLKMDSDDLSRAWNGLTRQENQLLFRSRDPVLITSLVMQGLLNHTRQAAHGKLAVELVHGSVTRARELDVIAVGTFEGVPLGGAGAALDDLVGGQASAGRAEGRRLISAVQPGVDVNWIYLASLGTLPSAGDVEERIRTAARETVETTRRHGLRRIGVVAYGGSILADVRAVAQAMLSGLTDLAGFASVTWFEASEERFERLREILDGDERVKLTTRRAVIQPAPAPPREQTLIVQVGYTQETLRVTVLPPTGNATAAVQQQEVSVADLSHFAEGVGWGKRQTPDAATLAARGKELADLLLGPKADDLLARSSEAKIVIVHDVPSSRFPFEMLCTSTSATPASAAGLSRRLAVPGVPVEHLFARPQKSGRFKLLLVINPTEDLPGAQAEGESVKAVLDQQTGLEVQVLLGAEATKTAVLDAFPGTDVLHYCGHAFFDGPGEHESGLLLAGRDPLTLADLRGVESPRIAFVNACEAGRVRGEVVTEAASFAEFFLRSGVEAYLGTFWTVNDRAAQIFSAEVYAQLASGRTLDEAVTAARRSLQQENLSDWANYLLFGDGRFRLVSEK